MFRGAWWLVMGVLAGCATTSTNQSSALGDVRRDFLHFDSAADGPTRWRTVETTDFTLISDLPVDELKLGAQAIAQSLAGLKAMFGKAPVANSAPPTIVALASDMEFERTFGNKLSGVTFSSANGSLIFVYGAPSRWFERPVLTQNAKTSVLQHELAHAVLRNYFPTQPRWFAEGLAQYLETMSWFDTETVQLGAVHFDAYGAYRNIRSIGVADLLTWGFVGEQEVRDLTNAGLYGESWAFVHWALNREPQRFGQYMFLLSKGDADAAWKETFAPMQNELDTAVFRHMKHGTYWEPKAKVPMRPVVAATLQGTDEKRATDLEKVLRKFSESSN